jgi:formimidoylglutamate deiminase
MRAFYAPVVAFCVTAGDHSPMATTSDTRIHADRAWLNDGWARDMRIDTGAGGIVSRIERGPAIAPGTTRNDWLLPGMANLHSHAFQRAMAGLAERRGSDADSFWSWRETMYAFATKVTPDDLQAIAAQLYVELLRAGYTQVCEFHYLHHAPDGRPYADPAAMSRALLAAADDAGIGITLLPVLYMQGGFDGRALSKRQARFAHSVDAFLLLFDALRAEQNAMRHVGIAFHSLRAVPPDALREVLDAVDGQADLPLHVHIAEQVAEVDDCVAARGARPVRWLLDNTQVDSRWTLVHATHLDAGEVQGIAASGATVAICPTTEANLGDGLFPLRSYLDAGGRWGIGSDSHISTSPIEELRWLEYGQRLAMQRRIVAADADSTSVGATLLRGALSSAGAGTGMRLGELKENTRADWITLDGNAPELAACDESNLLDAWIISGNRNLVRDVTVAGRCVVRDGRHFDEERIAVRYRKTIAGLVAG